MSSRSVGRACKLISVVALQSAILSPRLNTKYREWPGKCTNTRALKWSLSIRMYSVDEFEAIREAIRIAQYKQTYLIERHLGT